MNLKDIKIGLRLGLGFGSILILTVVLVAMGLFNIQKVQGLLFRIVNGDVWKLELAEDMKEAIQEEAVDLRNILLLTDRAGKEKNAEEIKSANGKFNGLLSELSKQCTSSDAKALLLKIEDDCKVRDSLVDKGIQLALENKTGEAYNLIEKELRPVGKKCRNDINNLLTFIEEKKGYSA